MDPAEFAIVEKWLSVRKPGPHPVFCTPKGREMKQPYVRDMLKRMAKCAGITKRVHPHGLRHTFANELAKEGERIHVIRRQLGHSNAATTASYLDHIAPGDVVEAIKKREWAA